MDPVTLIALLKDIVGIALLPLAYFSWKINQEFKDGKSERDSLKSAIKATADQNSREHQQVISAIKDIQILIKESEKDNRVEHKQLSDTIHEIDKNNTREHAILSNGGKL